MRWPLDSFVVTQTFDNPKGHGGIDLAAPKDTNIYSPVSGIVIGDGEDSGYIGGKYVIVREDTQPKNEFYMGHMSSNLVSIGQHVDEGQHIGYVGMTGKATGYHVHFQVRKFNYGTLIDPQILYNPQGDIMTDENYVNAFYLDLMERRASDKEVQMYINRPYRVVYNELRSSPEAQAIREKNRNNAEWVKGLAKDRDSVLYPAIDALRASLGIQDISPDSIKNAVEKLKKTGDVLTPLPKGKYEVL